MDDIFYMSPKNIEIKDIDEIARRINVKNTFIPQSKDILTVEYCDGVIAQWFCMSPEEFRESEDMRFLTEHKIKSIFCIAHHQYHFSFISLHLKLLLQEYGGWIGSDEDGFQPLITLA
ncbi:MAG: hypothetical protein NC092_03555 [Butyrivibrio sp.]|nr:hypothetical protein [Muribaculum sp.]MCM1551749.1 hypothetical protein [Butyrivibrio sp.]